MKRPVPWAFVNKTASLWLKTLSKMKLRQKISCGFCEVLKNSFIKKHLQTVASAAIMFFAQSRSSKPCSKSTVKEP